MILQMKSHLWSGTRPQRLCQLQSVLAQQNFAIRQQENPKLCPNSLVFQQGTQMPCESVPLSCVSLRKPQCTLAGKLENQISKRQDTHQQHYPLTTLQLSQLNDYISPINALHAVRNLHGNAQACLGTSTCLKIQLGTEKLQSLPEESTTHCPACYQSYNQPYNLPPKAWVRLAMRHFQVIYLPITTMCCSFGMPEILREGKESHTIPWERAARTSSLLFITQNAEVQRSPGCGFAQ